MYQVQHETFGVYQGHHFGLVHWHKFSGVPGQPYYKFKSKEEANRVVDFLYTAANLPVYPGTLSVEPFDELGSNAMICTKKNYERIKHSEQSA